MKKVMVIFVMLVGLLCCGCQQDAGYYAGLTATVNTAIDAQQEATDEILDALSGTIDTVALKGQVAVLSEYVDLAQSAAVEAAQVYEDKLDEGKELAIIEAVRRANLISAPLNPYALAIEGVLVIAAAVFGVKLSKRNKKYKALSQGVKNFKANAGATEATNLHNTIRDALKTAG